jgi:outer membrane protein OmpA-like peptidoglycan-associated protein
MGSLYKAFCTGVAVVALAACSNMGKVGTDESQRRIVEKIELQIPFDKWEFTEEHKKELAQFLKSLRSPTNDRKAVEFDAVVVIGHSDRIGPLSYNMKVSERLAAMTRDYLVANEQVDPRLIFWEGNGPKQPLPVTQFCDDKMNVKQRIECLAPNRRVTIEVMGTAMPQPALAAKSDALAHN